MRRQDELISLYAGQSPMARKFLISQMEGLSRAFDSEEILDFLQGPLTDAEPIIRGQTLFSVSQFLPGFIQRKYAVSSQTPGTWTSYGHLHGLSPAHSRKAVERAARAPAVRQAALLVAQPIIGALLEGTRRWEGWNRTRGVLALGHFGLRSSGESLASRLGSSSSDLMISLALAEIGGGEWTGRVLEMIRQHGPSNPDLYVLLGSISSQEAHSVLIESIPRTTIVGRANLARALAGYPPDAAKEGFRKLIVHNEGWVDAFALAALEQIGSPELLSTVSRAFRAARHWFLSLAALKAAGGIRCPASIAFCLDALRGADHRTCAVALESLVRLGAQPVQLRQAAIPYLTSTDVKARINAILAALTAEEAPEAPALQDLLWSSNPLWRLEAAYCLGYLQSDRSLELIATLATADPAYVVRHQAVKSLSKYPASDALRHLIPIVAGPEPRLALTAARVMTRYEGDEARLVGEAIGRVLERPIGSGLRGALYRNLGSVVARCRFLEGGSLLAQGLDSPEAKVLAGVLDGWALAGSGENAPPPPRLQELTHHPNSRIRARALLAAWHSGRLEAAAQLGEMLATDDFEIVGPALGCVLEMSLLLSDVALGGRFPELTRQLSSRAEQPEYHEFVSREGLPASVLKDRPTLPEVEFEVRRPPKQVSAAAKLEQAGPPAGVPPPVAPPPPPLDDTIPEMGVSELHPDAVPEPGRTMADIPAISIPMRVPTQETPPPPPAMAETLPEPDESRDGSDHATPTPAPLKGDTIKLRSVRPVRRTTNPQDLRKFLADQAPAEEGMANLRGALEKATYLIVDGLSPTSRLGQVLGHPATWVALVVLILGTLFIGFGPRPGTTAAPPRNSGVYLRIQSADGPCRTGSIVLKVGATVGPHSPLQTGPGGELIATTPAGSRVVLKEDSVCVFEGVKKEGGTSRHRFSELSGTILFEFGRDAGLWLAGERTQAYSEGASLRVEGTPTTRTVTVVRGEARVVAGTHESTLSTDQTARLE